MYNPSQLKRGLLHPSLIFREINRYYYSKCNSNGFNKQGIDIFERDWDNLFLLDACRYDVFKEIYSLPGRLEACQSKASATVGFLEANFSNRDLTDTVYVTANPQLFRFRDKFNFNLHKVINVWEEDGWDDEVGTVFPETMTEYASKAAEKYPNKRLLVHYIQPHYPFIESGTEFDKGHLENDDLEDPNFWYDFMYGRNNTSKDKLWKAYVDNLRYALPHVETLLNAISGKTIITSDHGNMFGERSFPLPVREWGHPHGIYTEELVKVPWLVIESESRREITSEESKESQDDIDADVTSRLRELGYAE